MTRADPCPPLPAAPGSQVRLDLEAGLACKAQGLAEAAERGSRKRKEPGDVAAQEPDPVTRCRLHDACMRILNRPLQTGDIVYRVWEAQGGQVAEVTLPSLPSALCERAWSSGVCENRRLARLQAAGKALQALLEDPELASLAHAAERPAPGMPEGAEPPSPVCPEPPGPLCPGAGGAPQRSGGASADVKTQVVIFCQWSCGRPMRKKDVVYTVARCGEQYQAKVQLNCFTGEAFTGEPRPDRRQAEQAAAELVLRSFEKERRLMAPAAPKKQRVQAEAASSGADPSVKGRLHAACTRILGRAPQAGDIVYEVVPTNGGPTATLRLPCLPGQLGAQVWASQACSSRHDARLQVADMALEAILREPALLPMLG
mmetsp:Transcript_30311/g.96906  ORF Transcript_30311/g.96906 Transcript_30311/m.96906 type:complete len:372 (-) Transcript_30311:65-1180(-)